MKKFRFLWIVVALVVLVVLVGATTLLRQATAAPKDVQIAFNSWVGYGPLYLARENGYFEKRGINVDIQVMEEVADRRSGLIAKRLDAVGATIDDLVVSAAQGVPGKMVLGLDESAGADGILATQDISSVEDFRGKTVAVQPGFVNHFFLLYILDANGLTSADVQVRPMDPDRAADAFVAGDVDIAVTWEPHLSEVQKNKPDGQAFLTSTDYPGLIVDILVFRDEYIEENPEAVAGVVAAWYEALDFLESNPDEAYEIMGQAMDIDPAELAEILSGVDFLDQAANTSYHNQSEQVNVFSVMDTAGKLWESEGYIAQPVEPAKLIDSRFLDGESPRKNFLGF